MTPVDQAAMVLTMNDHLGHAPSEVARRLNMADSTVRDIINGHHHWNEFAQGPVAKRFRDEQKSVLTLASRNIAAQCLKQVESQLPKASAYQAAGIYGLMRTHERLDMGEATENIAISARVDASNADGLAQRLAQRLVKEGS